MSKLLEKKLLQVFATLLLSDVKYTSQYDLAYFCMYFVYNFLFYIIPHYTVLHCVFFWDKLASCLIYS